MGLIKKLDGKYPLDIFVHYDIDEVKIMEKEKTRKNKKECLTNILAFYQTLGTKVFGFLLICSFAVVFAACGSTDVDDDGIANDIDNCPNVANSDQKDSDANLGEGKADGLGDACDPNDDGDSADDDIDIDDDGDGLIELGTRIMLDNMRYNLRGTSYDDDEEDDYNPDEGDNTGCGGQEGITECNGYELINDITLTKDWDVIIGNFAGTFDGKGFSISGLSISSDNMNVGFFATVSGTVQNIHLTGTSSVTGMDNAFSDNFLGSLVGFLRMGGSVLSSSSTLSVGGATATATAIGGLVGRNEGTIQKSYATGNIDYNSGNGNNRVGGLVGSSIEGTIQNSYATGNVGGSGSGSGGSLNRVGGLVGRNEGTIQNSYATGNINGGDETDSEFGGLVGRNDITIQNSYATGNVGGSGSGLNRVGGLVGRNDGTIQNSYATGNVNAGGAGDNSEVGGLVGSNGNVGTTIQNSYRNSNASISGGTINTAGTSKTVAELRTCTDVEYTGWSTNDWEFGTTSEYPALRSYKDDGSEGDLLCGQKTPRAQCP